MFFKQAAKRMSKLGKPVDPKWERNDQGKFSQLMKHDPRARRFEGKIGVYVIWRSGVRPGWVWVATSRNLARDVQWCKENEDIVFFERFGGLFMSWAFIRPDFQAGTARYLAMVAKP
ncbi:MAG: hypothetical protein VW268_12880 [Rhodospirillaceae bacterium]